ncbi:glycosyltransferase family 4 protein [Rhizobium sp. YTU87027]|uniref:glycosyltransferase family 4 protein n=1 Tax=Rhizobium sp. YTU87027 TaxID=3417741 RepID=UPI003D690BCF
MRIIFANRYFYPDQSATSRMVSSIAFALAQHGFDVTALAGRSLHNRQDTLLPAEETISGVRVCRLTTSRFGRQSFVGRSIDYLSFHALALLWLLRNVSKTDVAVICTDPPFLSVSSAIALKLRGARMINWIMDLFPETAIELGYMRNRRSPGRLARAIRDWSIKKSALIICPTKTMADYMIEQALPQEKIAVQYHWSNEDEIFPVDPEHNRLRQEWGLVEDFVVGYSGNFGRAHEFTTIIETAELLKDRKDIRFLLIGSGHQHAAVQEAVRERSLKNVIFKPLQPAERLAESLGAADVHLVSLLPRLEHCILPSKIYGILAAGRPTIFIGDRDGEVARILASGACGMSVAIGDAEQLALAIRELKDSPIRRADMGTAARHLVETAYSRRAAIETWCTLFQQLGEPVPAPSHTGMQRQLS